jgi:hypothetical protein
MKRHLTEKEFRKLIRHQSHMIAELKWQLDQVLHLQDSNTELSHLNDELLHYAMEQDLELSKLKSELATLTFLQTTNSIAELELV